MFSTYVHDGSLLAARLAERLDHSLRRTGRKAIARYLFVAAREAVGRNCFIAPFRRRASANGSDGPVAGMAQ
jgi:hypothetical protein